MGRRISIILEFCMRKCKHKWKTEMSIMASVLNALKMIFGTPHIQKQSMENTTETDVCNQPSISKTEDVPSHVKQEEKEQEPIVSQSKTPVTCRPPITGDKFQLRLGLERWIFMNMVRGRKSMRCRYCMKKQTSRSNLRRHMIGGLHVKAACKKGPFHGLKSGETEKSNFAYQLNQNRYPVEVLPEND